MNNLLVKSTLWAAGGLCLICLGGTAMDMAAQDTQRTAQTEQKSTGQEGFYCNVKGLTLSEQGRHKKLTEKLMTSRTDTVETDKGYEFQYSPAKVSVAEV